MALLDYIFRGFIFLITLPFGAAAGLIPGYIGGEILSFTGIPIIWCRWAVGTVAALLFCLFIQAQLFPSEDEIDDIINDEKKLKAMARRESQPRRDQTRGQGPVWCSARQVPVPLSGAPGVKSTQRPN